MADYSRSEEMVQRVRYRLPVPANAVELDKMTVAAYRERAKDFGGEVYKVPDDAITVTAEDDAIVFTWEVRS